jgi:hypothetical protein
MNRAATVEAGSELRQLALEEDTAAAKLPATLDQGSTVPVHDSDVARPHYQKALAGEKMDTFARGLQAPGRALQETLELLSPSGESFRAKRTAEWAPQSPGRACGCPHAGVRKVGRLWKAME